MGGSKSFDDRSNPRVRQGRGRAGDRGLARHTTGCPAWLDAGRLGTSGQAPAAVPRLAFEKVRLRNGLELILHVDRKLPTVQVNQWFHVGSKNERSGRVS